MSFPRIATVTAAVAFACAALPSFASAADYCVYPVQSCGPNNEMELQPALAEAAATSEADRILLGARTYFAPTGQQGFRYDATTSNVEIVGAGRGQTILTGAPSSDGQVLTLTGAPGSSIHDLAIQIPSNVTQDFVGLRTKSAARHIEVAEDQPQPQNVIGVFLAENGSSRTRRSSSAPRRPRPDCRCSIRAWA
jgi:hypothetical protein